jgi:hypothetical protein
MYYDFHEWIVMISMINKLLEFPSKHCYAGQKIDATLMEISWSQLLVSQRAEAGLVLTNQRALQSRLLFEIVWWTVYTVTVARQSDWALFTLGLNLAKSTSLTTRNKVANHSPRTPRGKQTPTKDIWSGDFHSSPNTFKYLHRGHFRYACTYNLDSCQIRVLK